MADRFPVLYRFYDADGALLYIGSTWAPHLRWRHHEQKRWFAQAASVTIEHFDDVGELREAESTAIRTEGPPFNVLDRPRAEVVELQPLPELDGDPLAELCAAVREHHQAATEALRVADERRQQRDELVRQLRSDDPRRWSYPALAALIGCSPELVAHIVKTDKATRRAG